MHKIIIDPETKGEVTSLGDIILIPPASSGLPQSNIVGHEIQHIQLGHVPAPYGESLMGETYNEAQAWKEAIRKMPKDEIDLEFINSALGSYVLQVKNEYGTGSPQLKEATRLRTQVRNLARKKKGLIK